MNFVSPQEVQQIATTTGDGQISPTTPGEALTAPKTPRQPLSRLGPSPHGTPQGSPQITPAPKPIRIGNDSGGTLVKRTHADSSYSNFRPLEIPDRPNPPPLTWTSPVVGSYNGPESLHRKNRNVSSVSMQDAAVTMINHTYPLPQSAYNAPEPVVEKAKEKEVDLQELSFEFKKIATKPPTPKPQEEEEEQGWVHFPASAESGYLGRRITPTSNSQMPTASYNVDPAHRPSQAAVGPWNPENFTLTPSGYTCTTCAQLCPEPSQHITLGHGVGCVDLDPDYTVPIPWNASHSDSIQMTETPVHVQEEVREDSQGQPLQRLSGDWLPTTTGGGMVVDAAELGGQEVVEAAAGQPRRWKGKQSVRDPGMMVTEEMEASASGQNWGQGTTEQQLGDLQGGDIWFAMAGEEVERRVSESGGLFF